MIRFRHALLIAPLLASVFVLTSCSEVPQSSVLATGTPVPVVPVETETSSPTPSAVATTLAGTSIITYTHLVSGNVSPNKTVNVRLIVTKDSSTLIETRKGQVSEETIPTSPAVWTNLTEGFPAIRTLQSGAMCGDKPGKAVEVSGDTGTLFAVGYQKCEQEWSKESVSLDSWMQPALDQFK